MYDLLILGDFAAREHVERAPREPLARRKTWRVDRDNVDEVMTAIAPELRIAIEPDAPPVVLQFKSFEDFHPDQLAQRVPLLQQLRALRAELAAPTRPAPSPRQSVRTSGTAGQAAAVIGGGSLLDRILDAPGGSASATPAVGPNDELSDFVNRAVQGHVVGDVSASSRDQITMVDETIAATLRVLLHDPSFQALEALWRGIDLITRRIDTSESLHLTLADVTRSELLAALADESDASAGGLRTLFEAPSPEGDGSRWTVAIAAHSFGDGNVASLDRLARLSKDAGVPCIAAAEPSLAGATTFGDGSDADDWNAESSAEWEQLRRSDAARWLALALPRFLARIPYGEKGEPCEVVQFEEIATDRPAHEGFLWGNPALLCAVVLGESAADGEPWATHGTVDHLPFHVVRIDGEPTAIPCAETLLSQRSLVYLLDRGLTALASERDGDAVRIPRLQSIANPAARLAIGSGPGERS